MSAFWTLPQGEEAALMPGAAYSLPGLFLYSDLVYQCLDQVFDKFGYRIPVAYLYGSPKVRWNCGRLIITDNHYTREDIRRELAGARERGDRPPVHLLRPGAVPGGPPGPRRQRPAGPGGGGWGGGHRLLPLAAGPHPGPLPRGGGPRFGDHDRLSRAAGRRLLPHPGPGL